MKEKKAAIRNRVEDTRAEEDYGLLPGLTHRKVKVEPYIQKENFGSDGPIKAPRNKKIHKILVK